MRHEIRISRNLPGDAEDAVSWTNHTLSSEVSERLVHDSENQLPLYADKLVNTVC